MKSKKGFTLVELLAVIVILAILLAIIIPQVTKYINKSRQDSFVATAKDLADAIRKDATSELYDLPISNNDVTIISLNLIKIEKGGKKSPYSGKWLDKYSYVAVINVGTDIDPDYKYYVAMADTKRYSIPLTESEEITRETIVRNDAKFQKAPINSLCGDKNGKYMILSKIAGLEKYQPLTGWNATVYSDEGC